MIDRGSPRQVREIMSEQDEYVLYNPVTGAFAPIRGARPVPVGAFPITEDTPVKYTTDVDARVEELRG